jgi:hypothetical protein
LSREGGDLAEDNCLVEDDEVEAEAKLEIFADKDDGGTSLSEVLSFARALATAPSSSSCNRRAKTSSVSVSVLLL